MARARPRPRAGRFEARPLTKERFADLVELFARPGAAIPRSCFCMFYRKAGTFVTTKDAKKNQKAMRALVDKGVVPGLVGYEDGKAVGWISLGPHEDYARLATSRVMKPLDDKPVWSVICFFVDKRHRGKGITSKLLEAGVAHARAHGATLIEGYPVDKKGRGESDFYWWGAKSVFDRQGFRQAAKRSPTRSLVRRALRPARRKRQSA